LHTLRSKIVLLQGQLDHERERSRRLGEERDEAVSSAGRAMNEVEALKSENRALKSEVANLKRQLQEFSKSRHEPSVKERIKEQVEAERKKDFAHRTRVPNEPKIPVERGFIQVSRS
jgi:predicted translin family RNA/ssDNA-binding protein